MPVLPRCLTVSRADTEHETAGMTALHPGEGAGHLVRVVLPHVHDAGTEGEGARRVEELFCLSQVTDGRVTEPQRTEPGLLDIGGQLSRHLECVSPDPEPS
jgi:hypothetical protein